MRRQIDHFSNTFPPMTYDCELWPMTLTFECNPDSLKVGLHPMHLGQVILWKSYCPDTQTHTHTGSTALPGPLK